MMKDRDQKAKALKFIVANRWFPQIEIDLEHLESLTAKSPLITDIDVLAEIPDLFSGFQSIIFDCKTKAKESPVNRALWLSGLLKKINGKHGYCIMKKKNVYLDHRLFAEDVGVTILTEEDFQLYANTLCPNYEKNHSYAGDIDAWEFYFDKISKYPNLTKTLKLLKSDYWNLADPATACRRLITELKTIRPELDPEKKEHLTLFFHLSSLFVRSLAIIATKLFKSYLHPSEITDLANALLHLIYGGAEAYNHRNQLYKHAQQKNNSPSIPDLKLPEWRKFVDLVRQFLDSPISAQHAPLILIEAGLSNTTNSPSFEFLVTIANQGGHAAKFALFANSYLAKAAKLPPEFESYSDAILLPIQP